MATFTRLYDGFIDGLAYLAGLTLLAMSVWVTYEVFMRYVFLAPTIWSVDLAEYALVYVTFLAGPWLLKHDGHVRIELLVDVLSPARQRTLGIAVSIVGAVVCMVFAWQTWITVADFYSRGITMNKVWQVPHWLPYAAMPVGMFFMGTEFLRRAYRYITTAGGDADLKKMTHDVRIN